MRFNNISVVDPPYTAQDPVQPRYQMNLLVGTVGGIMLGLLIAFGRFWFDRTFKAPSDVEERLGLPVLGVLPRNGGGISPRATRRRRGVTENGSELAVHDQPNSITAEAARALRTNLMFSSPDRPQEMIVVTSGIPFEGKTTVACWIATALAQTGKAVLLVDCDLRRPRIHRIFGRNNDRGISSLMIDPDELSTMDLSSSVPNLDVLPAGSQVPNPAELLQSDRFEHLLQKLRGRYDMIILDTPPINIVTDAAVLATKADGTMLVVRAHSTPYESAKESVRALADVSANLLGVVLNAVDVKHSGYRYGYRAQKYQTYYTRPNDIVPS